MQMRRKNLERRQNKEMKDKSKLLKNIETAEDLKLFPLTHYKEKLVVMDDVALVYQGENHKKTVVEHFNLEVRQGERVFLQGRNGCGKSSVIKAILNHHGQQDENAQNDFARSLAVPCGTIELPNGMVISYCAQDTSMLRGTVQEYARENGIDLTLLLAVLRKLDLDRIQFEKRMEDYSGGQKKKVLQNLYACKRKHY